MSNENNNASRTGGRKHSEDEWFGVFGHEMLDFSNGSNTRSAGGSSSRPGDRAHAQGQPSNFLRNQPHYEPYVPSTAVPDRDRKPPTPTTRAGLGPDLVLMDSRGFIFTRHQDQLDLEQTRRDMPPARTQPEMKGFRNMCRRNKGIFILVGVTVCCAVALIIGLGAWAGKQHEDPAKAAQAREAMKKHYGIGEKGGG